eukprot:403375293
MNEEYQQKQNSQYDANIEMSQNNLIIDQVNGDDDLDEIELEYVDYGPQPSVFDHEENMNDYNTQTFLNLRQHSQQADEEQINDQIKKDSPKRSANQPQIKVEYTQKNDDSPQPNTQIQQLSSQRRKKKKKTFEKVKDHEQYQEFQRELQLENSQLKHDTNDQVFKTPSIGTLQMPISVPQQSSIQGSETLKSKLVEKNDIQRQKSTEANQMLQTAEDIVNPMKESIFSRHNLQENEQINLNQNSDLKFDKFQSSKYRASFHQTKEIQDSQAQNVQNSLHSKHEIIFKSSVSGIHDIDDGQEVDQNQNQSINQKVPQQINPILDKIPWDDVLDIQFLNQQEKQFLDEFYQAEDFIVGQGKQPREFNFQKEEDKGNEQDQNNNLSVDSIEEKEKFNHRKLVLSSQSWYIHDQILFSLELKPYCDRRAYYGSDQEFEDYIIDPNNQHIFSKYKNCYDLLKQHNFHQYIITNKDLQYDYKTFDGIESNFQLVLYHLPQFVRVKAIDLPIEYLNKHCTLSVSSQSNIQIHSKNCVYFIQLDYFDREKDYFYVNNDRQNKVNQVIKNQQQENEPELQRYIEQVSFNIVVYQPYKSGDINSIINAAQLGTKEGDLQQLILTRKSLINVYHLPNVNQYQSDHDQNTLIEMKNCFICNKRALLFIGRDSEYYLYLKDSDKVIHLKTDLRMIKDLSKQKKQKSQNIKDHRYQSSDDESNKDLCERMNLGYLIGKHKNYLQAIKINKEGSYQNINLGRLNEIKFLRMIDNFEKTQGQYSQIYSDENLSINFINKETRDVCSFDIVNQKFRVYNFNAHSSRRMKHCFLINTGKGTGCGYSCQFEKYLVSLNKNSHEGYSIDCFALTRNYKSVEKFLTWKVSGRHIQDLCVDSLYVDYIVKNSLQDSYQVQFSEDSQLEISKSSELKKSKKTIQIIEKISNQNGSSDSNKEDEGDYDSHKNSIPKSGQLIQNDNSLKYQKKQSITPTYIFDSSDVFINHFRYQCQMGHVQGIYKQHVIYSRKYDKQRGFHDNVLDHRFLKCNSKFLWQAQVLKNQLVFTQMGIEDYGKRMINGCDLNRIVIQLHENYLINEAVISKDNQNVLIDCHFENDQKYFRKSFVINLRDKIPNFQVFQIENFHSVIHFDDRDLYTLQSKKETQMELVIYKINENEITLISQMDLSCFLRQNKNIQTLPYNNKPQSYFHFIYKKYFILQLNHCYYMIIKRDDNQFLGTFEFEDKNLFLVYENEELYIINQQ